MKVKHLKEYNKGTSIGCIIGAATGLGSSIIVMLIISQGHTIKYPIEQWYFAQDWLAMVYPLLCSIPFCWETFYQRKSGYLQYVTNRKSHSQIFTPKIFFILGTSCCANIYGIIFQRIRCTLLNFASTPL